MATGLISPFSASGEIADLLSASSQVSCRAASSEWELELHHRIRREVFVAEQRFFEDDDRDEHDEDPGTIHVISLYGSLVGGTVRLYPLERPGEWKGDRLAVLRPFRRHGLGAPLVNFAVETAGRLGGRTMIAKIQLQNVSFFERLGWHASGAPGDYLGVIHQTMEIDL